LYFCNLIKLFLNIIYQKFENSWSTEPFIIIALHYTLMGLDDKATLKTIRTGPDDFNKIAQCSRLGTITRTTEDCCGCPFICQTNLPWGIPYLLIVTIRAWLHYNARGNFVSYLGYSLNCTFVLRIIGTVWLNLYRVQIASIYSCANISILLICLTSETNITHDITQNVQRINEWFL